MRRKAFSAEFKAKVALEARTVFQHVRFRPRQSKGCAGCGRSQDGLRDPRR
jgi:hypothetical protein